MIAYPLKTAKQLGAILRGCRKARGLTQADLGKLVGLDKPRISRIEADPSKVSFDRVLAVISALGCDLVIQPPDAKKPNTEW